MEVWHVFSTALDVSEVKKVMTAVNGHLLMSSQNSWTYLCLQPATSGLFPTKAGALDV